MRRERDLPLTRLTEDEASLYLDKIGKALLYVDEKRTKDPSYTGLGRLIPDSEAKRVIKRELNLGFFSLKLSSSLHVEYYDEVLIAVYEEPTLGALYMRTIELRCEFFPIETERKVARFREKGIK